MLSGINIEKEWPIYTATGVYLKDFILQNSDFYNFPKYLESLCPCKKKDNFRAT